MVRSADRLSPTAYRLLPVAIMTKGFEVSPVGVFFSLVAWHFSPGPVGTILAAPMTITIKRLYQEFAPDVRCALTD